MTTQLSRYRIAENNGQYRIEQFRQCGFLWLRRDWRPVDFLWLLSPLPEGTFEPQTGWLHKAAAAEAGVSLYQNFPLDLAEKILAKLQAEERLRASPWRTTTELA